jgi:flagellar basal-body rod modification protein FlgD
MNNTVSAAPTAGANYATYTKETTGSATPVVAKKNMDQLDFLNLLTTQLKNQDPMNPQSDTDFAAQMAQYSGLQQMQKLNDTMSKQSALSQMSSAASMIGKTVITTAADASGKPISGQVTSVAITPDGAVTLNIGDQNVPLSKIAGITRSPETKAIAA